MSTVHVNKIMKHHFTYKLIDRIDSDVLLGLKKYVLEGPFVPSNDFQSYTLTVKHFLVPDPAVLEFFGRHMSKFFDLRGHIETNVAKMVPGGYVPEHSDYSANTYGKSQDGIIKFQVPIITNPGAGLMWRWDKGTGEKAEALFLEEGGIYMFNNCRVHSSVNLGKHDRYWITTRWRADSLLNTELLK